MADDLALGIVRDAEALRRRDVPIMIATITLVPLPPNLVVPGRQEHRFGRFNAPAHESAVDDDEGGTTHDHGRRRHDQRQRWFAVRGVEPGRPERTFLHAEEAISFAAFHGFRRLVGDEEREWSNLVMGLNGMTGRDVGDFVMILAREGEKGTDDGSRTWREAGRAGTGM